MRSLNQSVSLSIVVPAYNEAARIERSLDQTLLYLSTRGGLATRGGTSEIVVVDDGSRDDTASIVSRYAESHPQVRLIKLPGNRGKGAAIRAGVAATHGARVLMMDADLATPIEEIELLDRALDEGAQVATASRAVGSSDIRRAQSPLRVMLGRLGNLWIQTWAVPGIRDTQCGFKLFEGDIARRLFALCKEDRFGIDIEVLHYALRHGYRVAEVGVRWEHQEGSKVRPRDYVDVLVKVPKMVWNARRASRFG